MPATLTDLQTYLAAPEGARLEFKEAKGGFHFEELVKYCVALANEGGGKIILAGAKSSLALRSQLLYGKFRC